jgi:hypothetical protein
MKINNCRRELNQQRRGLKIQNQKKSTKNPGIDTYDNQVIVFVAIYFPIYISFLL